ncbi:MAG: ABC transporter permease [Sphingobacteriaceae bacterium]|nr:MAG: ABC transporter permease [Sphingobacteriaceae bacterium]
MLKNYIKTAWRNLWKGRVFNTMNIIGLSVAVACCILLFLTVSFQLSYDKFHGNIDKIHQLTFISRNVEGGLISTSMPTPLTPALKDDYQDIRYITRMANGGATVKYGTKEIEKNLRFVDPDFFRIFTFPVISGNKNAPLNSLNDVALTQYAAKAIFGDANPVGKTIELKYGDVPRSFVVSSVLKDFPENSSVSFDMLVRFENTLNYQDKLTHWDWHDHPVFMQLHDNVDATAFNKRLQVFVNKNFKSDIDALKKDGAKPDVNGNVYSLNLLPFANNHFAGNINGLEGAQISKAYIYSLLVIGIFILTIACINFVNLSVARAFTRAREVGVRKTLGAGKLQLLVQFWVETFMVCLFAMITGVVIANFITPGFNATFRANLHINMLFNTTNLLVMGCVLLLITVLAGLYPALLMMRFKTVSVLKGSVGNSKPGRTRNVLLVTQFTLSSLLIVCTLISWQQISYLKSRPLGYNKDEVISIPIGNSLKGGQALELFRNKMNGQPGILSLTGAYDNMGSGKDGSSRTSRTGFEFEGHTIRTIIQGVSYDFLKTLDIKLIDGREFSRAMAGDSNAVIINEKMAAQLGNKLHPGDLLPIDEENPSRIIGIMKDYNYRSLRTEIEPLTLVMSKDYDMNYIFVRVKPDNLVRSFNQVQDKWHETFPNVEFSGSWINENTERQYMAEQRLSTIFISGAVIAIIISCIGLLAMSFMIMVQRTKEIGIRKVLGANVGGLVLLLSRDFLKLVLLAALIAFPLAWWLMSKWLESYVYRISIHWWIFALAAFIALGIAFITVSFQSLRAALANPVKSLRSE